MREVMRIVLSGANHYQLKRIKENIAYAPAICVGIFLTGLFMAAYAA